MIIYKNDILQIDKRDDLLVQNWSKKSLSVEAFQSELMNYIDICAQVKPSNVIWFQENFDLVIPDKIYKWVIDEVVSRQHETGTENVLFTIPDKRDSFYSLLDFFGKTSHVDPLYFSNEDNVFDYLHRKSKIEEKALINYNIRSNDKNIHIDLEVSPEDAKMTIDQINKLNYQKEINIKYGSNFDNLTVRELEVFSLIITGKTNREIADLLFVSNETIKSHRKRIIQKLQIEDLSDWLKYANLFNYYGLDNSKI